MMRPLALLLLVGGTTAQQLTNPGFEADSVPQYTYMTPTGWTAGGGVVVVPSGSGPWGGLVTPDGSYYASVQGTGAYVEQVVSGLRPGGAYNVRFWAAERPGYGSAESMRVVVDGVVVMDSSHPPEAFGQLTAVFVASSSTATVRFENDSPDGDNSFFIDAVTVTPVPGGGALSCEFQPGDGIGGTESQVGEAPTAQACMQMVHQTQPSANGVTYSNTGGTGCYAEFGMTGNNDSPTWQTCLFTGAGAPAPPPPPSFGFENNEVTGCRWMVGSPTDGTSTVVGTVANGAQCATLVSQQVPTATAASFYIGGGIGAGRDGTGRCSAVTGMTTTDQNTGSQTCLFIPGFCNFVTGDGAGGTEAYVADTATAVECVNAVLEFHPDANGATYASEGNQCYAEFGMTGPTDSDAWHTCLFPGDMSLCTFVVGDGVGDSEESLGDANSEMECVSMVRQMRPNANGATYSARGTGTSCYAEFGMTESNGSASWQTCMFDNSAPDHLCGPGDTIRVTVDNTALQANGLGGELLTDACVFPFTYGGVQYNSCTTADFGDVQWCSLSARYGESTNAQGHLYGICDCAGASSGPSVAGCTFIPGDGTGGEESFVGDTADAQACASMVVAQQPAANGATYSNTGGTACYAEFGQTGSTCPPGSDASCSDWQNCVFSDAPATTGSCAFGPGDGTGGTEANVGDASTPADCVAMVMREEPTANGVTYSSTGGTGCFAEFGMTGANDSAEWQSCMLAGGAPPAPVPSPSLGSGCAWTSGDGVGEGADAHEQSVGDAPTAQACVQLVQQTQPGANGATYQQGGTACYAEFGMSGRVESDTWQTCVFETAGVGCAFAEGDGTGDSEEYVGDTDTPDSCVALVHSTRPEANGVTYSNDGGAACYAEFGMTGSTGAPSAWQSCVIGQGGATASCADSFASAFATIQTTCCATDSDCDHGTPATCNSDCGDLVTDFWRRCEAAVAESFGAAMHDQLDAFARVCDRTTGAGSAGPPPPPAGHDATAQECASLATTEIPSISHLCCKNQECGVRAVSKCSRACAEVFVPFFTQCGALSYPAASIQNLAQLAQTCVDRNPGVGSGH